MWNKDLFFERLMVALSDRHWSLYELSVQDGLSSGMIYRWKNQGIIPSMDSLQKISDALQVPVEYLLSKEEKSDKEMKIELLCVLANQLSYNQLDALIGMAKTLSKDNQ